MSAPPPVTTGFANSPERCPSAWNAEGYPNETAILQWVNKQIADGTAYLEQQRAFEDLDKAIDIIAGRIDDKKPSKLSRIHINRIKRDFKEVIAHLSNVRPIIDYKAELGVGEQEQKTAHVLNNRYRAWYLDDHVDDYIEQALQYAGLSKGYLEIYWDAADLFSEPKIALKVHGPRGFLPIQMGKDHDIQKAYGGIIINDTPLALAHMKYPEFRSKIVPDRVNRSASKSKVISAVSSLFFSLFGPNRNVEDDNTPFPSVDIFHIYVKDDSLNETEKPMTLEAGTKWERTAYPLGYPIPTGLKDDAQNDITRPATVKDAMLYPNRRLIICTKTCVIYDGPSYYWHGLIPIVSFELDKWAWEFLGYSLVRDAASIQDSATSLLRGIDDSQNLRLNPPKIAAYNRVSQAAIQKWNLRQPGNTLMIDDLTGEIVKFIVDPRFYDVPQAIPEHVKWLYEQSQDMMGLPMTRELARAAQIPSGDSIEKIQELSGPALTKMSRRMEKSLGQLGDMFKWLVFEFEDAAKRFQLLGKDGETEEDWDFDPGTMIPATIEGRPDLAGEAHKWERARIHAGRFKFHITPNSMHNVTQFSRKLLLIQLSKIGFPIDPWTIAEALDMVGFGPAPAGANTIIERWRAWKIMEIELAADAQELMAELQAKLQQKGLLGQIAGAMGGNGNGAGQGQGGGRDPSFNKSASLEQKDGGARTSITTS